MKSSGTQLLRNGLTNFRKITQIFHIKVIVRLGRFSRSRGQSQGYSKVRYFNESLRLVEASASTDWRRRNIYIVVIVYRKLVPCVNITLRTKYATNSCPYLCQILTDFQNFSPADSAADNSQQNGGRRGKQFSAMFFFDSRCI